MTLEILCNKCGSALYRGLELRSTRDILKSTDGKCNSCNSLLSSRDFELDISPIVSYDDSK
tara:strand:+ start:3442 stop:3624 length:183 start_codon:yes stop_codon:yes gene_type:complete